MRQYFVYLLAGRRGVVYVGVTNNLPRRMQEHRQQSYAGSFTAKYRVCRLVYYESFDASILASERERQIKSWRRAKKVSLIRATNPGWKDLSGRWFA